MSTRKPDEAQGKPSGLVHSFACAFSGIGSALLFERNLRVHFALSGAVLYFAQVRGLARVEWAALILTLAFVIVCELINTAIERLVDLAAHRRSHPLARAAKDIAAGAVLCASVSAVAVGICLFGGVSGILETLREMSARPLLPVLLLGVCAAAALLPCFKVRQR